MLVLTYLLLPHCLHHHDKVGTGEHVDCATKTPRFDEHSCFKECAVNPILGQRGTACPEGNRNTSRILSLNSNHLPHDSERLLDWLYQVLLSQREGCGLLLCQLKVTFLWHYISRAVPLWLLSCWSRTECSIVGSPPVCVVAVGWVAVAEAELGLAVKTEHCLGVV